MRGKVLLVPFPFDDLSGVKVRPAVCLTSPVGPHRHIVIAFISSVVPSSQLPTDIVLDPADPSFSATGLRVRSVIRLHRLATIAASIVRRELGELAPAQRATVNQRLRQLFGL
jgi:mRNA interferase MazF